MDSLILKSTTTLLIIISTISIAVGVVFDTDGNQLQNGGQYFIIPQRLNFPGGSLTLRPKISQSCPFFITPDATNSPGIPVTISKFFQSQQDISQPGSPVHIVFDDTPNVDDCSQPLEWKVFPVETESQRLYIAAGVGGFVGQTAFTIVDASDERDIMYKIQLLPVDGDIPPSDVGIFNDDDKFLGLTNEIPLLVKFQKFEF